MRFDTEVTLTGPWRSPAQMLADQEYDGHASVHDEATASSLGLAGARPSRRRRTSARSIRWRRRCGAMSGSRVAA